MSLNLDRVDTRGRLKPRRDPYYQRIAQGRFVGFRLMDRGASGTWLARFYDGERYRHQPLGDFATLPEKERFDAARAAADEWFRHLDLGGTPQSASVAEACRDYVEELKSANSMTAAHDAAGRFRRLVDSDPLGRIALPKLSALAIAGWKKRVLATGMAKGTYNRNATALRAALNLAHKRKQVASDHAWLTELAPFEGADGRRDLYLAKPARRKLIDSVSGESAPLVLALALLPLRPGDAAKLKVRDLDAQHGVLSVPKGKTAYRKIPISGTALAHFKTSAQGKEPDDWIFARAGGQQWKKESWRDEINAAAVQAKLPAEVCAYTLRHSAITDLVTSGLDLFHVAQLAGTSIAMIEKNYGHLRRKEIREGLKVLALD